MADDAGALLWQAANSWQRLVHAAFSPLDLTYAQAMLLMALVERPASADAPSQVELAHACRANVMMTSQILRLLERRRLVRRLRAAGDARARRIVLTAEGEAAATAARAALSAALGVFFAPLGAERGEFAAALGRLIGIRARLRVPSSAPAGASDRG